jgi:hypothetical protein
MKVFQMGLTFKFSEPRQDIGLMKTRKVFRFFRPQQLLLLQLLVHLRVVQQAHLRQQLQIRRELRPIQMCLPVPDRATGRGMLQQSFGL